MTSPIVPYTDNSNLWASVALSAFMRAILNAADAPTARAALGVNAISTTAVKTANYTASANEFVPCDTTSGSFTITLPTAPADGVTVGGKIVVQALGTTVSFACGGSDHINTTSGPTTAVALTGLNQAISYKYNAALAVWYAVSSDSPGPAATSTATAAGTTTLTVGSAQVQEFTGSTTQTVVLPTTSAVAGKTSFVIINKSTGVVTVNASGGATVVIIPAGLTASVVAYNSTPTVAADWTITSYPTTAATGALNATILRDSSGFAFATSLVESIGSTATSAGTTTLTQVNSPVRWYTGTQTHTVVLPAVVYQIGQHFILTNLSTGAVTVNASGGSTVATLTTGQSITVYANTATPTTSATWTITAKNF